jgi:hypothetical protein
MIECTRLSDRMIEVLHRGKPWTAEESAHLAACPDCAAEWLVVSRTAALGAAVPAVDSAAVATRVRSRLAAARPSEPRPLRRGKRFVGWGIGLAAAAAVLLAVIRGRHPDRRPAAGLTATVTATPNATATEPLLTELDELSAPELEVVLKDWQTDSSASVGTGLGDLTPDELERVLRSWEG